MMMMIIIVVVVWSLSREKQQLEACHTPEKIKKLKNNLYMMSLFGCRGSFELW